MLAELRPALMIARREVRDQFRDWRIIFPIIGLTVFFPFLMNFTASQIMGFVAKYGAGVVGERLVPFLLMITGFFPISVSLVIALETFVGEKERGSIEPLLNSPLKDWQLYLGKLLSATIPPLLSSYLGMTVYLVGISLNHIALPPFPVFLLVVVLSTVQAFVMVAGAVVVSSQATSVRAANLLASFIIIPIALLVQGESIVMFWGNYGTLWWAVVGLFVLGIALMRIGLAHFQREELLGREIDVLNIRWMAQVFWRAFRGEASSLKTWFSHALPRALQRLKRPMLVMCGLLVAGFILGIVEAGIYKLPLHGSNIGELNQRLRSLLRFMPVFSFVPVLLIFWQNLRVLILSLVLGTFSLGILGVLPVFATMLAAGYLFGLLTQNGIPMWSYLGLILPHGIFEIPAAIIASAGVLQTGAILATSTPGKTVGEVWIDALGEWTKLMVGVVIPLLLIGACIEAWVTPQIALLLFP